MKPIFTQLTAIAGMPDLTDHGLIPAAMAYESELYDPDEDRDELPRQEKVAAAAHEAREAGQMLVLDLEQTSWAVHVGTDDQREEALDKRIQVIDWVHEAEPGLRVGTYRIAPTRNYWAPVMRKRYPNDATWEARYREWKIGNARIRKNRDEDGRWHHRSYQDVVDFVAPSLYTFYDDQDGWEIYAKANIREARKFQRPVYAYLWPHYHRGGQFTYGNERLVEGDYWRKQLDLCHEMCDGIIIWGFGWNNTRGHLLGEWDNRWPWWRATQMFLAERLG